MELVTHVQQDSHTQSLAIRLLLFLVILDTLSMVESAAFVTQNIRTV